MRLAWEQDSLASAAPIICSRVALNNIAARSNRARTAARRTFSRLVPVI
jgi:hypothetical protein